MRFKKILSIVLASVMIFSSIPIAEFSDLVTKKISKISFNIFSQAQETVATGSDETVVDSGACGDNISWIQHENGTLVISGTGDMDNFYYNSPFDYSDITTVIIEKGVTSVGDYAFYCCTSLETVVLPDGVTRIGDHSFYCCESLMNITIPAEVTTICDNAFASCYSLENIIIPDSVTSLGTYVFNECSSLKSVTMSANVTQIGSYVFSECEALTNLTIPYGVTSIGYGAFESCCSLESIIIPDSVENIGSSAFSNCDMLADIVIPDSVTSIGDYAFGECDMLENIDIPDSVITIGERAFADCRSLVSVIVDEDNPSYSSFAGALYNKDKTKFIYYPVGRKDTAFEIPDGVTDIGVRAFYNCKSLENISMPDSVTTIEECAFMSCENLENICISNNITIINDATFYYCSSLRNVSIPDGVTRIGVRAFAECDSLTDIVLPVSVYNIDARAFAGCGLLRKITIYNSECEIYGSSDTISSGATIICRSDSTAQEYAEYYNRDFEIIGHNFDVIITDPSCYAEGYTTYVCKDCGYSYKDDFVAARCVYDDNDFDGICDICGSFSVLESGTCGNLTWILYNYTGTLVISGVGEMPDFDNVSFPAPWGSAYYVKAVRIEEGITNISKDAFADCYSLETVVIPDSVTSIDCTAFSLCADFRNIIINENNPNYCLVNGVLYDKDKTTLICYPRGKTEKSFVVPDGITSIGTSAFYCCANLVSIEIPNSVTSIGMSAFYACSKLESIDISDNVISIGMSTFSYCAKLESIDISASVRSIGAYAFYGCQSLKSITIFNPECEINSSSSTISGATIFGYSNSTAQAYAKMYDREFVAIDSDEEGAAHKNIIFLEIGDTYQVDVFSETGENITNSLYWKTTAGSGISIESPGYIKATKYGLYTLTANKDDSDICLDSESWYVFVGKPNVVNYSTIYDSVYYYSNGGFISNAAQISDAVEVYMAFENTLEENLLEVYNKDFEDIYEEQISSLDLDIGRFTITATVSGKDLSFSKDKYVNSYTAVFDGIDRFTIADDLLMLYPYNLSVSGNKKNYTISIKIESEDFETIEDSVSFDVASLESKAANEHIEWLNDNTTYKTTLNNAFGKEMVNLKNNGEYKWSKYSTFDFDNYYEVVIADMLVEMLGSSQMQMPSISLVPDVIKEFLGIKKEILSIVDTIANDEATDFMDFSVNAVDKFFSKESKFRTDGIYTKDVTYQLVQKLFGNTGNIEKINKTFEVLDKTKQFTKIASLGVNTAENIIDYCNRISVLNSFKNANDSLTEVFVHLYNEIPATQWKMRDAVEDYITYSQDALGVTDVLLEEFLTVEIQFSLDLFATFLGKSCIEALAGHICNWIGTISLSSGATLSSTAAFATISSTVGLLIAGVTAELCVLDILCNSSEKSAEMSKIVAMSEFSPYIIETVKYYENKLIADKNDTAVELFEQAFAMHKTSQKYIVQHTRKALIIKRDSIIENLFDRKGDYEGVLADTLAIQREIENMTCHSPVNVDTIVRNTKVIAVMCPVDVFVYDENGELVVEIANDTVVFCADGFDVCITESQKFIVVPADKEYDIKIIATDDGTMDYKIFEYDAGVNLLRKIEKTDIPLVEEKEFTGYIPMSSDTLVDAKDYSLNSGSETYETELVPVHSHTEEILPAVAATCTKTGLTEGKKCSSCGEILVAQTQTPKLEHNIISSSKAPTCTDGGYTISECSMCDYSEIKDIPATGHKYSGGVCVNCGASQSVNCGHMCHQSGFNGFIWKIVRFFWKLFNMNPVCECGVAHY